MIYLSAELVLPRKPELVWSVLADALAYASWVEGLKEVEAVRESAELAEGAMFDVTFRLAKVAVHATTTVAHLRAPSLLTLETRIRDRLVLFDRLELGPVDEGTLLTAMSELGEEAGVMRLFHRSSGLLGAQEPERGPQKVYERSFRSFAKLVEARTAAPYR